MFGNMEERYLSTRDFARILGVSRVTVIKWIKTGRIAAYNVHGKWRIPYSEVERLVRGERRIRRVLYMLEYYRVCRRMIWRGK